MEPGRKKYVILPKGYPRDLRRLQLTQSHGGGSVNFWGAITHQGFLAWTFFKGGLDSKKYINIIKTKLLRKAGDFFEEEEWTLQQDNDSAHTSDATLDALEELGTSRGFHIMKWPSRSPDLNPIENAWSHIKDLLSKKTPPTSLADLEDNVAGIIEDLNENHAEYFEKLYASMRERLEQVVHNHGGSTTF